MNVLYKKNLRRSLLLLLSLAFFSHLVADSVFAASSVFTTIKTTNILLNKKGSSITAQGTRPVIVKDNLKVTGNITLNAGKTVDGVDVGNLAATVAALQLGTGAVTYTAGTGVSINGTTISTTLGTSIESSEITDATVTADDLADNSVGAGELANTAIQNGDIETADLPSNLTISEGTINNTPIGATTASTGNFSNVTLNGESPVLPTLSSVPRANTITTIDESSDDIGYYPSITTGQDGLSIFSYGDISNRYLKVGHCSTVDCSTSTTTTVSTDATYNSSMAIGADGLPVIVYARFSSNGVMVIKCGNATCTSGNTTTNINSDWIDFSSITIGTDGFPVIAYINPGDSDLTVVKCGNAACSSGNVTTDVDTNSAYSFSSPSIAIAPDGFPVMAYYKDSSDDLMVAKCTNASCSTSGTQTLDSTNNVGLYSSLVIGTDGLPVISYYDDTNDNLMIAKCGDATCTNAAATITTVDSTGNVGAGNSITIGSDGFPIVAYMDQTSGTIKYMHCGNAACSSGNNATAPVNLGTTSFFITHMISLTVGRNNLPVIAYFDQNTFDLKVAALANPFGVNYMIRR
jgi:hypothetical protein